MPGSADYRRRADEYRALSKAASRREREGLLWVAMLLETLAQHEDEREETQRGILSKHTELLEVATDRDAVR